MKVGEISTSVQFFRRVVLDEERVEDNDTARVVTRFQAGDQSAYPTIYSRYFDRVYAYLRVILDDSHEAEDAAQQVFVKVFQSLPGYELRGRPFRAWLFRVARNYALSELRRDRDLTVADIEEIDPREPATIADPERFALGWVTDQDLTVLVERLPVAQRQIIALRYMLGLTNVEIATVVGRSPEAVGMLHHRALCFLRARLASLGRTPHDREKRRMRRYGRQADVLRSRRFILVAPGPRG